MEREALWRSMVDIKYDSLKGGGGRPAGGGGGAAAMVWEYENV
jgi:hypothetical protein